jgi:toxin YhaV
MVWRKYYHTFFVEVMQAMYDSIIKMKMTSPKSYMNSPQAKLFASIIESVDYVSEDPTKKEFFLGNTLGKKHRDWRRAKRHLPPRYRLFFKYFVENKDVYFAWINDTYTLRKEGSKTDVYYVFKSMLNRGDIPSERNALKSSSSETMTK